MIKDIINAIINNELTSAAKLLQAYAREKNCSVKRVLDWRAGKSQKTLLHYAVDYERPRIVKFLLRRGANPNIPDYEGKTPLDYADGFEDRPRATAFMRRGCRDAECAEILSLLRDCVDSSKVKEISGATSEKITVERGGKERLSHSRLSVFRRSSRSPEPQEKKEEGRQSRYNLRGQR